MGEEQYPVERGAPQIELPVASATAEDASGSAASRGPFGSYGVALLLAAGLISLSLVYLLTGRGGIKTVQSAPQEAAATSVASLEALVRTSPTTANRINLSLAYINGGQPANAIPVLNAALAEDKTNVIAWNNLCVAHTLLQDYASGIEACNHALAGQPDFPLARNNLKWATDERDATIKAISVEEQTDTSKRDGAFYLTEGMNFLHIGNYPEAIHAWQRALAQDPHNAAAANDIGIAMMYQKQPTAAIPWFQRAISLDPTLQLAKNNLAWARQEEAKTAR